MGDWVWLVPRSYSNLLDGFLKKSHCARYAGFTFYITRSTLELIQLFQPGLPQSDSGQYHEKGHI